MKHSVMRSVALASAFLVTFAYGLTQGTYGGKHWSMKINADGSTGTVEGDCSSGTVSGITEGAYVAGTGKAVNFSMVLGLQFKSGTANAGATKVVNVTDALLAADNLTLTGTLNSGSHSETFKVVHLVPADLFKCISAASALQVQHVTLAVVALTLAWQQYSF